MEDFQTIGIVLSIVYLVLGVTGFFALLSWNRVSSTQAQINEILLDRMRKEDSEEEIEEE